MSRPTIVPELYVSDIQQSLAFYVNVVGFAIRYDRPEERFAFLERDGAELMIEQTLDPARMFSAANLEYPFGRGMHLQIEVADADVLFVRIEAAGGKIAVPLEDHWYRIGGCEEGNRQFVAVDPDGYLLRFWHDLGKR